MMITITKLSKLRAAITYLYCPSIDTSSATKDRHRKKIEVIAELVDDYCGRLWTYGSDDDAHQGDAGKAAMQRDKDADSNKDEMT